MKDAEEHGGWMIMMTIVLIVVVTPLPPPTLKAVLPLSLPPLPLVRAHMYPCLAGIRLIINTRAHAVLMQLKVRSLRVFTVQSQNRPK